MRLLLFGSSGQIGTEILHHAKNFDGMVDSFTRAQLDITDHQSVAETIIRLRPEVVINATGYHVIPDCEKFPDKAFDLNVYAVKNLARHCESVGATLINYSTDKVFDGSRDSPHREDEATNPLQMYGISKLAGEIVTHESCSRAYTIRTCGVFGGKTGSRIKKGNFVLYILNQAKTKKTLEVSSDQVASFVNAADLAEVTLELIIKKAPFGIYHVVNDGYDSWVNFAREIIRLTGGSLEIIPVDRSHEPSEFRIPSFQALANTKTSELGITLSSWQDGLKRYLDYLTKVKTT